MTCGSEEKDLEGIRHSMAFTGLRGVYGFCIISASRKGEATGVWLVGFILFGLILNHAGRPNGGFT
ncbi:hypothetical protein GE09DRAFT_1152275 [Coniochaeta sp. 2T2.1]|nr:hypothetical protein GE09DRAFT_1152275 [Coniochaeta sp. 2T2.1]